MLVNKAQAEAAWPQVAHNFPGVDIAFGDEDENGMAELSISEGSATAQSVAFAMGVAPGPGVNEKPNRFAVAPDFIDHGLERKRVDAGLEPVPEEEPEPELSEPEPEPAEVVGAGAGGEEVEAEEAPPPPKKKAAKKSAAKKSSTKN